MFLNIYQLLETFNCFSLNDKDSLIIFQLQSNVKSIKAKKKFLRDLVEHKPTNASDKSLSNNGRVVGFSDLKFTL